MVFIIGYVVGIPEGHLFAIYDKKPQRSNTLPWLNSDCPKSVTVLPGGKQSNAVCNICKQYT